MWRLCSMVKQRRGESKEGEIMRLPLIETLMKRDKISLSEAEELVEDAKMDLKAMLENDIPIDEAEFMYEWFGLEPDYFFEVLPL